jgi:uncharacterized metal-binding protein
MPKSIPILFACSGCSNAGQLADKLARELNRRGIAEMSCLAGIGAGKPHFLRKIAEREVWIIDGCPIECSLGVFSQFRGQFNIHIRLHDLGVRKNDPLPTGSRFDDLIDALMQQVAQQKQLAAFHDDQRTSRAYDATSLQQELEE